MEETDIVVGCANPYSLAEEIAGKRIDWSKEADEFETLAKCFGITKEGFLSDESPIESPYLGVDEKGIQRRLSDEEAEKRVSAFLQKYMRPESFISAHAKTGKKPSLPTRAKVRNTILMKSSPAPAKENGTPDKSPMSLNMRSAIKKPEPVSPGGSPDPLDSADPYEWKDKGYFFNEVPLWSDVCQNSIGDCYFLSSLCSVVYTNPFKIRNVAGLRADVNDGVRSGSPWHMVKYYVPQKYHADYSLWYSNRKTTRSIVVSEDVLVSRATGFSVGASGPREIQGTVPESKADADACWVGVYEKAYAKFLERDASDKPNMKGRIDFGSPEMALKSIIHTELVKTDTLAGVYTEDVWKICENAKTKPTCATILEYSKKDSAGNEVLYGKAGTKSQYTAMGLYTGHAYSVLGTHKIDGVRYVVIRNPHGRNPISLKHNPKVYHGDWSFNFGVNKRPEYRNIIDVYKSLSGHDNPQTSQGLFLLELKEFKRVFDSVSYYYGKHF